MLINFTLVPVENVQPWGSPGNLSLSWFGLTDGQYWIQAGESTLFEYTNHAQAHGGTRYCDYQVVRLYEDLMGMLPDILEPVPPSLVQYISSDTRTAWQEAYHLWLDRNADRLDADRFGEIIHASTEWLAERSLDSGYLSPSANIMIWSDELNVHFEWDNRTKFFNERPAWTALIGTYTLQRDGFITEIKSFHSRLMEQMAERVERVLSGALSSEINVDFEGLVREQEQRCKWPSNLLPRSALHEPLGSTLHTDWQKVEKAINEIMTEQSA